MRHAARDLCYGANAWLSCLSGHRRVLLDCLMPAIIDIENWMMILPMCPDPHEQQALIAVVKAIQRYNPLNPTWRYR
jgi:hypothetical protein